MKFAFTPQNRERERESKNHLFSFQNLLKAYYACRKNKRKSRSSAEFEFNYEKRLLKLEAALKSRTWHPLPLTCFPITDPKLREVWASEFSDRVVHHLLVGCLEPIFEKKFIFHSYACRKNKGAHKAVSDLNRALRPQKMHFFQADIRSFFASIDKNILFSIIRKTVKNPDVLWLAEKIIYQDPVMDCRIKGDASLLESIPRQKSLFSAPKNKGLPIGNLTSQFFANIYLNELDQFIKHNLKCRRYFRYMDDFVILHPSKDQLLSWRGSIAAFLHDSLSLNLHPKKQILQSANKGLNFCGYIIKPEYRLIRRRTVKRLKNKLYQFNRRHFGEDGKLLRPALFGQELEHIFASINSTYGSFRHADCFGLRKSLYEKHFRSLKDYLIPACNYYHFHFYTFGIPLSDIGSGFPIRPPSKLCKTASWQSGRNLPPWAAGPLPWGA